MGDISLYLCTLSFLNGDTIPAFSNYYIKSFYTFNYMGHTTKFNTRLRNYYLFTHINPRHSMIYEDFKPQFSKSIHLEKLYPLAAFNSNEPQQWWLHFCLTSLLPNHLTTKQNFHTYYTLVHSYAYQRFNFMCFSEYVYYSIDTKCMPCSPHWLSQPPTPQTNSLQIR